MFLDGSAGNAPDWKKLTIAELKEKIKFMDNFIWQVAQPGQNQHVKSVWIHFARQAYHRAMARKMRKEVAGKNEIDDEFSDEDDEMEDDDVLGGDFDLEDVEDGATPPPPKKMRILKKDATTHKSQSKVSFKIIFFIFSSSVCSEKIHFILFYNNIKWPIGTAIVLL